MSDEKKGPEKGADPAEAGTGTDGTNAQPVGEPVDGVSKSSEEADSGTAQADPPKSGTIKADAEEDPERAAKVKAAAEARAARAAAKVAQEGTDGTIPAATGTDSAADAAGGDADAERAAKIKAAEEARAARAAAKAAQEGAAAPETPKEPSPNQPRLDRVVQLIRDNISADAVLESFINERDGHRPYLVIQQEHWTESARFLKESDELGLKYLRNVSGTDMETHLEVAYHLISLDTKDEYCVKVKTDRNQPSIPSVTSIWQTANWNEREIYDLFGIDFPGHPDLRRIMMSDDWVGHPLRKDYEPIDPEV